MPKESGLKRQISVPELLCINLRRSPRVTILLFREWEKAMTQKPSQRLPRFQRLAELDRVMFQPSSFRASEPERER